jgi:Lon protease-like protein
MGMTLKVNVLPIPNVVFFPHASLPIFVVDQVYVRMIRDCIENNELLVVTMAEHHGVYKSFNEYGHKKVGSAGRPIILEELPDGTLKVLIKGVCRVTLETVIQNLPYLVCEAEELHDEIETETMMGPQVERLRDILNSWLGDNIPDSVEREIFCQSLISIYHIIDYVCMFLIRDRDIRQLLLENRSLYERIQMLNTLLQEPHPYIENPNAVSAIKSYEILEKTAKFGH